MLRTELCSRQRSTQSPAHGPGRKGKSAAQPPAQNPVAYLALCLSVIVMLGCQGAAAGPAGPADSAGIDGGRGVDGSTRPVADGGPLPDRGPDFYPTFERDIVPILDRSCGSTTMGCHDAEAYGTGDASRDCRGWLSLVDGPLGGGGCAPRDLYARLVDLDAWGCDSFDPRVRYVRACDPQNSYLFRKIAGGPYCRNSDGTNSLRMPMVGMVEAPPLPDAEIDLIEQWILAGAPRDGEPRIDCNAMPPIGSAPVVEIWHPSTGETRQAGRAIPFTTNATDAEDGDITASVIVTSDVEGEIGRGRDFSWTPTTLGTQVITARVIDSNVRTDTAEITLSIVR